METIGLEIQKPSNGHLLEFIKKKVSLYETVFFLVVGQGTQRHINWYARKCSVDVW
jgi:hypothetical protein